VAKDILTAKDIQTIQPGQVSLDRLASHVNLRGQPEWVSLDKTERTGLLGHDSDIKRAVDKGVWAEQLEQTAGTGQQGQDSQDGTAGTGQPGRTAGVGHLGQDVRARQLGQDSQDSKAGTGMSERPTG
jgi:hypothetical protein